MAHVAGVLVLPAALGALGTLGAAVASGQTTVQVGPAADAFVSSASAGSNYGGAGGLAVSANLANGQLTSLLGFVLANAKTQFDATYGAGQWVVQSASLQLTAAFPQAITFNSPSAAGTIAATWQANDAWVEGTGTPISPGSVGVTWNTLPSLVGAGDQSMGSLAYNGSTGGTATYPLTVSSGFGADLLGGSPATLRLSAGDAQVSGVFNSRSYTNPPSRPVLNVTAAAVPEPTGAALLIAGVSARGLRRRRAGRA
jgi:hypothetical protein